MNKFLFLILSLCLTACCQPGTRICPTQPHSTHNNSGLHLGTSSSNEPLAHTQRGLNPVSEMTDRVGN